MKYYISAGEEPHRYHIDRECRHLKHIDNYRYASDFMLDLLPPCQWCFSYHPEIPPAEGHVSEFAKRLSEIEGVGEEIISNLLDAGYTSVQDIKSANGGELRRVHGVGWRLNQNIRESFRYD